MKLLSIKDVAEKFNVPKRTIDNWLYNGIIPQNLKIKMGRLVFFNEEDLEEFILSKKQA